MEHPMNYRELKLRSSSITVIFCEIAEAYQTYNRKDGSHCIDPHLASIMATDLLILPRNFRYSTVNAIYISLGLAISPYLHVC
jgi:hypothetical protein